jgi:hypothetical protein
LLNRLAFGLFLVFGIAAYPAAAGNLTYVCDQATVSESVCASLGDIAKQYDGIFDNLNATIYVRFGDTGSNVGENHQFYNTVKYSDYYDALGKSLFGTPDQTAFNSLAAPPLGNPLSSLFGVSVTSTLDAALSLSGARGACTTATNSNCDYGRGCGIGTANCYNDIITLTGSADNFYFGDDSNPEGKYDFFTTVEHETDEAMGTSSCLAGGSLLVSSGCFNGIWGLSAADLYRYSEAGTRGFAIGLGNIVLPGANAYFSIDGGDTSLGSLYNLPLGPDWGDLSDSCNHVQDAIACPTPGGLTIANDGGVEIAMLDAVGYRLTLDGLTLSAAYVETPEPSSAAIFAIGLGMLGLLARRRRALS